jgi:iron complex outermembrane receptor protein
MYYRPVSELNISLAGAINHITYQLTDLFTSDGDQSGRRNFPLIITPRIGINYSPSQQWAVYASAGNGYSLPSPEETLLPEGDINPGIKPERGMQYEFGTRMNFFDKRIELDGSIYWIELNNLLVTKRITEDIFTGINAGKTRHLGLEILMLNRYFSYENFPGQLKSSFSYTHSLNRFIDFTDDTLTFDGNNLPGIPRKFLRFQLTWNPFRKTGLITDLQYAGFQYLNDLNTLKYPDYFLCSIKINNELKFKKTGKINIYFGINNLTNTRYASMLIVNALGFNNSEPRYYYPGLPRHGYAGIQYYF